MVKKALRVRTPATSARRKPYPNPKFPGPDEEAEYWKTHSPLLEGYEGTVQARPLPRPSRTSFLSVRLSGEEIERLRRVAERAGLAPSTLARALILQGLQAHPAREELARELERLARRVEHLEKALAGSHGPEPVDHS